MFYDILNPAIVKVALFTWGETVLSSSTESDPQNVMLAHSYSHVNLEAINPASELTQGRHCFIPECLSAPSSEEES